ncbi:hypothetical protein QUF70_17755 [Desulfobacterales bacterium HSG17]|nr:hypothetical protein [Desulfobacterales bacterium HSG17]
MGSLGSGRRYKSDEVNKVVENQISINILDLKKRDCLKPGNISSRSYVINGREIGRIIISAEKDMLSLDYRFNGLSRQQTVQIAHTSPNFGGRRKYLVCPECQAKREMIYFGENGKFACRVCHDFIFRSQQLPPHQRHAHMTEKYAQQLGGTDFILHGQKPLGIWGKTFFKLQDKYFMHRQKSCDLFIEYFNQTFEKYGSEKSL